MIIIFIVFLTDQRLPVWFPFSVRRLLVVLEPPSSVLETYGCAEGTDVFLYKVAARNIVVIQSIRNGRAANV